jgi:hypothetical protein
MKEKIIKELNGNYSVTTEQARLAVEKHFAIVQAAIKMRSQPYYPAGEIAKAEGFQYHGKMDAAEEAEEP